jgi:hypothetical protein
MVDFHGVMRFSWDFGLGFSWKFYMNQEHEFLCSVCVNDVVLRLLREMDLWKMVWFWKKTRNLFLCVFMRNFYGLCFENGFDEWDQSLLSFFWEINNGLSILTMFDFWKLCFRCDFNSGRNWKGYLGPFKIVLWPGNLTIWFVFSRRRFRRMARLDWIKNERVMAILFERKNL